MKNYLYPTDILVPKSGFDKWSVIACDQYTSDKKYWQEVENIVGESPSTLRLVLPEIYLSETEKRIGDINATMNEYLTDGVFETVSDSMVYIEREITGGAVRKGILGVIDLTDYEYESGTKALIRATEQTVAERIPPRVKIRKDAPLEFPHVLLFIDDPDDCVIKTASDKKSELEQLYDFNLMQNGGRIAGYRLKNEEQVKINEKLGSIIKDGLLFAVGDGNHSLATAKECYNKSGNELARFAMVEVVNIHNSAIVFEPIYRVLFNVNKDNLLDFLIAQNSGKSNTICHEFEIIDKDGETTLSLCATSKLPVGTLQGYLDAYLMEHPEVCIDYIHGIDATKELCQSKNTVGFIFEGMKKDELFEAVVQDGSLPRKTFSMGHADDKRFYLEGRKIK